MPHHCYINLFLSVYSCSFFECFFQQSHICTNVHFQYNIYTIKRRSRKTYASLVNLITQILHMGLEVIDSLSHRFNILSFFIGNFTPKFIFEGHD